MTNPSKDFESLQRTTCRTCKIDAWKMKFTFRGKRPIFRAFAVSFREGKYMFAKLYQSHHVRLNKPLKPPASQSCFCIHVFLMQPKINTCRVKDVRMRMNKRGANSRTESSVVRSPVLHVFVFSCFSFCQESR